MDNGNAGVIIYLIMGVVIIVALLVLNNYYQTINFGVPKSLNIDCKVDIKWEDYSCVIGDDVYVSCPHPTHIECKGDIPLAILEKMNI